MPIISKNQGQLSQEMADAYTDASAQPEADVSNGTVNRDIMDVSAIQIATAYAELETARQAASLKNALTTSEEALSQFALNFDVIRNPATYATGTVTFQARTRPSVSIGIPAGTIIQTQPLLDGTIITYTTDEDATLSSSATPNPLNGLYEVDVDVTASEAGTDSHVGVNSLTVLPNRISGISSVINKQAINDATDEDDNEALSESVLTKTAGSSLGTPSGYEALILAEFPDEVSGVALVSPFDSDNLRVQFGNEVDVPVISVDATSFTAVLTTSGAETTKFTATRPVLTVTSVVGATSGIFYVENLDWGFSRDTGPVYGFSTMSFDALCWFPNRRPALGVKLSVQGTYDSVVTRAQTFLDNPEKRYLTSGLLVKTAQEIAINVTVSVAAASGVDRSQLETDIVAAITDALAEYTLGQDVLEDDLINVINAVSGVEGVDIPFTTLARSPDTDSQNALTIRAQEYARAGTITVTVN